MRTIDDYTIIRLREKKQMKDALAEWFSRNWSVPLEAYRESMAECIDGSASLPQWYAAVCDGKIVGGLGVIENDFHDRKDLSPNVCAVYVEKEYRCRAIAGALLRFVCEDMKNLGIRTLYLLTQHTSFYERYGWKYLCTAKGDGEETPSRVYVHVEK